MSDQVPFRSGNKLHSMILCPRRASLPFVFSIYRKNTKINPYYYSKRGQNSAIRSKCLIAHTNSHHTMNGSGLRLTLALHPGFRLLDRPVLEFCLRNLQEHGAVFHRPLAWLVRDTECAEK